MDLLPLSAIIVGDRRREDLGDIAALATSIATWGLLHPIVVDADSNLIAGERRLRACESLGYVDVPVRYLGTLTATERREIELEENLRRKDLTAYERSKALVERTEIAKEVLPQSGKSIGRPPRAGVSQEALSDYIGTPRQTLEKAEQHVETAESYPFMQAPDWKQYHVLQARESLSKLPEAERPDAVALVAHAVAPPQTITEVLGKLAAKPAADRSEIYRLQASADPRERSLALTKAAELPPMPDPRWSAIREMERTIKGWLKLFPADPLNQQLRAALELLSEVERAL
jgi:hypothetical protein